MQPFQIATWGQKLLEARFSLSFNCGKWNWSGENNRPVGEKWVKDKKIKILGWNGANNRPYGRKVGKR